MSIDSIKRSLPFLNPLTAPTIAAEGMKALIKGPIESVIRPLVAPLAQTLATPLQRRGTPEIPSFPDIVFPEFPSPPPPPPPPSPPPPTSGQAAQRVGASAAASVARRRRRARLRVGRAETILTGGQGPSGGVAIKRLLGE